MSRSAADATRFTATGPYITSKPSAIPYKLPNQQGSPTPSSSGSNDTVTETPRQKVERLRAQARAARLAQSTSTFDRVIEVGRRVANRAHKAMVYTLIGASGICGALTIYSVFSLSAHNRRQRELWLDRQLAELQAAREAYVRGTPTPEQLEVLLKEKRGEVENLAKEEARQQLFWNRAKRMLFEGKSWEESERVVAQRFAEERSQASRVIQELEARKKAVEAAAAAPASAAVASNTTGGTTTTSDAAGGSSSSGKGWLRWPWSR